MRIDKGKIQKGLEADARLSEQGPGVSSVEDVASNLSRYMKENNVSFSQMSKALGYSAGTLQSFVRGSYCGKVQELSSKITSFLNDKARKKRQKNSIGFINTTVAMKIKTLITQVAAFSDDEGKIGLIIGDGGHGKSFCLGEYAKINQSSIYILLDQTMRTTSIFKAIAAGLGIGTSGSMCVVAERIVRRAADRHCILLLDEASHLTVKQLDQVRQIIAVKAKTPVVLAGNSALLKIVMSDSHRGGYESLDQFTSRLVQVLNLDEIASEGGGDLYTASDVRRLYEYGGIRLVSGAVDKIKRILHTPQSGRMRTCSLIIRALHVSGVVREKGEIAAEMIRDAIIELDLPVKNRVLTAIRNDVNDGLNTAERSVAV